jgi:hypothetical protein
VITRSFVPHLSSVSRLHGKLHLPFVRVLQQLARKFLTPMLFRLVPQRGFWAQMLASPAIEIVHVIARRPERGWPDLANDHLRENCPPWRLLPVLWAIANGPWPDRLAVAVV